MEIFKRKIKKWLILSAIFVLAIIILVVFIKWSFTPSIRNTEKYKNYKIYDYHLSCDMVTGSSKAVNRDDIDIVGVMRYKKFFSVSDDQFICLSQSIILDNTPNLMVLQNPDNYVDVFNEWKVKKVELLDGDKVINTLTDQNIVSDFKKFINSEKDENELINPSSYVGDHKAEHYNIRIYYEESEYMRWETLVYHYTADGYGELIYVEQIDSETGESSKASISNYPEIYNWLSDCFENIDSQESN